MWRLTNHPAELQVRRESNQVEVEIGMSTARQLLKSGGYRQAMGLLRGKHFRKELGSGCYHLRMVGQRAWLHWDRWDPRRFPVQHFFETPALWGTTLAAGSLAAVLFFTGGDE